MTDVIFFLTSVWFNWWREWERI